MNPLVTTDNGPRPAGPPDRCFYCSQRLGRPHTDDCVLVTKTTKIRLSFEIEVDVPRCWNDDDIEYQFGSDSSWCCCIENIAGYMKTLGPAEQECLCDSADCKVVHDEG